MLSARVFLGRALVRARSCTNAQVPVQYRITSGHHIPQLRHFQRGPLLYRKMLYKDYVRSHVYQVIVRHQSDGPSSEKKLNLMNMLKRLWGFLAVFLLIHFLVIYYRYKNKRKGGRADSTPPFAIETKWDHDLKRKFTIVNEYTLPDFINERSYNDIYNFRVHPDDVYVVSFPKSGKFTAWFLIPIILHEFNWVHRAPPDVTFSDPPPRPNL